MCLYFYLDVSRLTILKIVVDFMGAMWYSITIERERALSLVRTLGNHEEQFGCRQVARR